MDLAVGDVADSGLLNGGRAEVPFVEALMVEGAACLELGDAKCEERLVGLPGPAAGAG